MANPDTIKQYRAAWVNKSRADLIQIMAEQKEYSDTHIAAKQELDARDQAERQRNAEDIAAQQTDIERRHREQLEISKSALDLKVRHHDETIDNSHRVIDRQIAAARRAAWIPTGIAIVAAGAAVVSAWQARQQPPAQSESSIDQFEARLRAVELRPILAPSPAPEARPLPQPLKTTPALTEPAADPRPSETPALPPKIKQPETKP